MEPSADGPSTHEIGLIRADERVSGRSTSSGWKSFHLFDFLTFQFQRTPSPQKAMAIPRDQTPYGVYQIGEVYARSWRVILTASGISMPKRLAS